MASQSHLRPNSRIVGYATALVVGLVALFLSWRIFVYTQLERDWAWVHFTGKGDLIGSLQEDDPVAVQGVTIGQIEEIQSVNDGVRVRLRFWKHQKLWKDASASNVGNGLMGMRFVLLRPGLDTLHPLDRNADVPGTFNPGIAEVMSGIEQVVARVQSVLDKTHQMAEGDAQHPALEKEISEKLAAVETILSRLDAFDRKMAPVGGKIQSTGRDVRKIAQDFDAQMPELILGLNRTDTALVKARELMASLRKLSRNADTMVQGVAKPLEPFSRDDSLLRKIESTLVVVDEVQDFVDGKIRTKYHFHIWGDNPSKHGE